MSLHSTGSPWRRARSWAWGAAVPDVALTGPPLGPASASAALPGHLPQAAPGRGRSTGWAPGWGPGQGGGCHLAAARPPWASSHTRPLPARGAIRTSSLFRGNGQCRESERGNSDKFSPYTGGCSPCSSLPWERPAGAGTGKGCSEPATPNTVTSPIPGHGLVAPASPSGSRSVSILCSLL